MIGGFLLDLLQQDDAVSTIRLLVRRPIANNHPKVEVKLIDFNDHESFKLGIDGSDVVFCVVGTTQAKVKGNKEAYRKIDFDIPVKAARFCKETGCHQFITVTAAGANSKAINFYLKLKGEAEDAIRQNGPASIAIFRPSLLLGERKEKRTAEKLAQVGSQLISFLFIGGLVKYKPIHAKDVAMAMIQAAKRAQPGFAVYEYPEIRKWIR
jgi:uncharacterized protein YbjT (DUF2867 family)